MSFDDDEVLLARKSESTKFQIMSNLQSKTQLRPRSTYTSGTQQQPRQALTLQSVLPSHQAFAGEGGQMSARVNQDAQEGIISGVNSNHHRTPNTSLADRMGNRDKHGAKTSEVYRKNDDYNTDVDAIDYDSTQFDGILPLRSTQQVQVQPLISSVIMNSATSKPPLSFKSSSQHKNGRVNTSAQGVSAFGAQTKGENSERISYQGSKTTNARETLQPSSAKGELHKPASSQAEFGVASQAPIDSHKSATSNANGESGRATFSGMLNSLTFGFLGTSSVQENTPMSTQPTPIDKGNFEGFTEELSHNEVQLRQGARFDSQTDQELLIECSHCNERINSRIIDEHEIKCSDHLSQVQKRKLQEIPATKIVSTQLHQIKSLASDDDDFASVERTPSRNAIVHQAQLNSHSEHKFGGSPFAGKGIFKQQSGDFQQVKRGSFKVRAGSGLNLTKLIGGGRRQTLTAGSQYPQSATNRATQNHQTQSQSQIERFTIQEQSVNQDQHQKDSQRQKVPGPMTKAQSHIVSSPGVIESNFLQAQKKKAAEDASSPKSIVSSMLGLIDVGGYLRGQQDVAVASNKETEEQKLQQNNSSSAQNQRGQLMSPNHFLPDKSRNTEVSMPLQTQSSYASTKPPMQNVQSKGGLLISRHSDSQKNMLIHQQNNSNTNLAQLIGGRDNKITRRQTFTQRAAGNSNTNLTSPIQRRGSMAGRNLFNKNNSPFQKHEQGQILSPQFNAEQPNDAVIVQDVAVETNNKHNHNNNVEPKVRNQQKSGQTMSTNDQSLSNPSPNTGIDEMLNRTQLLKGLTTQEAIEQYDGELTPFEKSELTSYDFIYTVGSVRIQNMRQLQNKDGFYNAQIGEQLGYRYLVDKIVDAGAFGQVVKAIDMKDSGKVIAIKISKSKKQETDNARVEAKLLKRILGKDPDKHHIVRMYDSFYFRRHFIIVFELLDINLYRYIKQPGFRGMNKELLREIAKQMLKGLDHLAKIKIIHCDLKPENVLFTDSTRTEVKIIDFGSACTEFKSGFSYVQSRFYRSPEVVLGLPYDQSVDMWSFGCILAELVTGRPLFPAIDEHELLELIRIRIGMPPSDMISKCKKRKHFFGYNKTLIRSKRSRIAPDAEERSETIRRKLQTEGDHDFIDFIEKCLEIDPKVRITPEQALQHIWIKQSKLQSIFKENQLTTKFILQDLEDVMRPLPTTKRERITAQRQAQQRQSAQQKRQNTNTNNSQKSNQMGTGTQTLQQQTSSNATHTMGESQSFQALDTVFEVFGRGGAEKRDLSKTVHGNISSRQPAALQDSPNNSGNVSFRPSNPSVGALAEAAISDSQ